MNNYNNILSDGVSKIVLYYDIITKRFKWNKNGFKFE